MFPGRLFPTIYGLHDMLFLSLPTNTSIPGQDPQYAITRAEHTLISEPLVACEYIIFRALAYSLDNTPMSSPLR
jgi:hypothetical protein